MPGAAGAQPLGQRALRGQLDLQLAGQVLPGELLVAADERADRAADPAGVEQDAQARSSTPQLLEIVVRSRGALLEQRRRSSAIGTPQSPNPPTASVAPSAMSATASAAVGTTLSIMLRSVRTRRRAPGRRRCTSSPGRSGPRGDPSRAAAWPGCAPPVAPTGWPSEMPEPLTLVQLAVVGLDAPGRGSRRAPARRRPRSAR